MLIRQRLVLLCVVCALGGCAVTRPAPLDSDIAQVRADVAALCDPAMEGRGVTTQGIILARDFIAGRFAAIGLQRAAVGEAGQASYLQPVPLYLDDGQIIGHNVVATLPGRGGLASQWIVIAAHYDHLGFGDEHSRAPEATGQIHPGADDNASGVAALLWIAERMQARGHDDETPRRSVAFVALTAEEIGQLGAHLFVLQRRRLGPEARVVAMLNLDMVGNLTDDRLRVFGVGTGTGLRGALRDANRTHGLRLSLHDEPGPNSDHLTFHTRRVPAMLFITGLHPRYHTPDDTPAHLDYAGIVRVAGFVAAVAEGLAIGAEAPVFVGPHAGEHGRTSAHADDPGL